jgi:hypothetical protein
MRQHVCHGLVGDGRMAAVGQLAAGLFHSAEPLLEPPHAEPQERLGVEHMALGIADATASSDSARDSPIWALRRLARDAS